MCSVIVATRAAVYLQSSLGAIWWLTPPNGVRHSRALRCHADLRTIRPGDTMHVVDDALWIGQTKIGRQDNLARWTPPRLEAAHMLPAEPALARLSAAARLAAELPGGTDLLRAAVAIATGSAPAEPDGDPFSRRAVPALVNAARGLATGEGWAVESLVAEIGGLGPGLTPSGDDVIGGVLFAAACIADGEAFGPLSPNPGSTSATGVRCDRGEDALPAPPTLQLWGQCGSMRRIAYGRTAVRPDFGPPQNIVSNARHLPSCSQDWETEGRKVSNSPLSALATLATRTHPISLAIVSDLAAGLGPEPLHMLASEILDGRCDGPTAGTMKAVTAIGHRSGRDLLAGFFVGLCMLRGESRAGRRRSVSAVAPRPGERCLALSDRL